MSKHILWSFHSQLIQMSPVSGKILTNWNLTITVFDVKLLRAHYAILSNKIYFRSFCRHFKFIL